MDYVINEWLLHYPIEGRVAETAAWLQRFARSADRLLVLKNSHFTKKLQRHAERSRHDQAASLFFRGLFRLMLNSERVLIFSESGLEPLSEELARLTPSDDLYLIALANSIPGSRIVTTDTRLIGPLITYFQFLSPEEYFRLYP